MTTAKARAPRYDSARELALRTAGMQPGILQSELADRLRAATAIAPSTAVGLLRAMERDGMLAAGRVGRRKSYRLPAEASSNGTAGSARSIVDGPAFPPAFAAGIAALALLVAGLATPDKRFRDGGGDSAGAVQPQPESTTTRAREPSHGSAASRSTSSPTGARRDEARPAFGAGTRPRVRVVALSGVGIPGIAARTADKLRRMGLRVGSAANAATPVPRSVVLYRRGRAREAAWVGRRMRIGRRRPIDAANRAIAARAGVVVVLGADSR